MIKTAFNYGRLLQGGHKGYTGHLALNTPCLSPVLALLDPCFHTIWFEVVYALLN